MTKIPKHVCKTYSFDGPYQNRRLNNLFNPLKQKNEITNPAKNRTNKFKSSMQLTSDFLGGFSFPVFLQRISVTQIQGN